MAGVDVRHRDQDARVVMRQQAVKGGSNGGIGAPAGGAAGVRAAAPASAAAAPAAGGQGRSGGVGYLAVLYIALLGSLLLLVKCASPLVRPHAFDDSDSLSAFLRDWSPLPQAALLALVLLLAAAIVMLRAQRGPAAVLPPGVRVDSTGVITDEAGVPLARGGFRLAGATIISNASGSALPSSALCGWWLQ
jgi:hypothetical protein